MTTTQPRWLVLLGGNPLNGSMVRIAAQFGAPLLVVDWNEHPEVSGDLHLRLDIKDHDAVTAAIAMRDIDVLFAYSAADAATETVARLNAAAGLHRSDATALDRARDKRKMSLAWKDAGLLGKRQAVCADGAAIRAFLRDEGDDAIVKPVSSSSSRGISVLPFAELAKIDFAAIWERAAGSDPDRRVLVESYIRGTEYTVEMIGDAAGNVETWGVSKKYHTLANRLNRIAVKLHYNPPDVPRSQLETLARFGADCYRTLGLRATMGHFEVIMDERGRIVPVELAARSSGFIATDLLDALVGTDGGFFQRFHAVLQGDSVSERLIESRRSSMYFFYDPPAGTWIRDDASLADHLPDTIRIHASERSRLCVGTVMKPIDCDNDRVGYEVMSGPREVLTPALIDCAERALYAVALAPAETTGAGGDG